MLRYKEFDAHSHLEKGHVYEFVAKKLEQNVNTTTEKPVYEIIEVFYGEDGYEAPSGYEIVCPTDNSVLNVLAETNPKKFYDAIGGYRYHDEYPDSEQEWCEIKHKDVIINTRCSYIEQWIKNRVDDKETNMCLWDIRINGFHGNIYNDPKVKEITDILERNGVEWQACDTISGAWNLNHDFIETKEMECAIEFCGVYPVNWKDIRDIAWFEYMVNMGYIYIHVLVKDKDGNWIGNY